jgi:DNA-3-methyladenine glycosylase
MVAARTHDIPDFDELGSRLPAAFFARPAADVARDLLGHTIVSRVDGVLAGGRIVETEAYLGSDDPGSHAATRGVTERNRVMYGPPGVAYVYFTYGMHHMLNLVTGPAGVAGAVLVRAMEPTIGCETMVARRHGRDGRELADGPGKVAAALGLDLSDNATVLGEGRIAVLEAGSPDERVLVSGRIGLARGHELPLRFYLEGTGHSRGRPGPPSRSSGRGKG